MPTTGIANSTLLVCSSERYSKACGWCLGYPLQSTRFKIVMCTQAGINGARTHPPTPTRSDHHAKGPYFLYYSACVYVVYWCARLHPLSERVVSAPQLPTTAVVPSFQKPIETNLVSYRSLAEAGSFGHVLQQLQLLRWCRIYLAKFIQTRRHSSRTTDSSRATSTSPRQKVREQAAAQLLKQV